MYEVLLNSIMLLLFSVELFQPNYYGPAHKITLEYVQFSNILSSHKKVMMQSTSVSTKRLSLAIYVSL